MYSFVKVCPPARKVVRNLLFRYRGRIYRRASRGVSTDPNLMVFCVFSGRGYSDSPRALYEYMASPGGIRSVPLRLGVPGPGPVPLAGGALSQHHRGGLGGTRLPEGHGGGQILDF